MNKKITVEQAYQQMGEWLQDDNHEAFFLFILNNPGIKTLPAGNLSNLSLHMVEPSHAYFVKQVTSLVQKEQTSMLRYILTNFKVDTLFVNDIVKEVLKHGTDDVATDLVVFIADKFYKNKHFPELPSLLHRGMSFVEKMLPHLDIDTFRFSYANSVEQLSMAYELYKKKLGNIPENAKQEKIVDQVVNQFYIYSDMDMSSWKDQYEFMKTIPEVKMKSKFFCHYKLLKEGLDSNNQSIISEVLSDVMVNDIYFDKATKYLANKYPQIKKARNVWLFNQQLQQDLPTTDKTVKRNKI